jgi:hypothetical protein
MVGRSVEALVIAGLADFERVRWSRPWRLRLKTGNSQGPWDMPSSDGRSSKVASPRSKVVAGRGVGDGGMMRGTRGGATMTDLSGDELLEEAGS